MYYTLSVALPYVLVAFIISFALTPIAKKIGLATKTYAIENKRTVHNGNFCSP